MILRRSPKIFGIGLSKTGTKSLNTALNILGIRATHYNINLAQEWLSGDFTTNLKGCDGVTDIPDPVFYSQLDELFPGSKFILTVRELGEWLKSTKIHWHRSRRLSEITGRLMHPIHYQIRIATYGIAEYNKNRFEYVFQSHKEKVIAYFKNRPEDLLIMDITAGDHWEKLCSFLNKPIPKRAFPWVNRTVEEFDCLQNSLSSVLNKMPENMAADLLEVMEYLANRQHFQ